MRAVVSLANDRGNYYQGLARLGDSLKGRFDGKFFGFMGEHSVGAPPHLDNNYAFKVYAIDYVRSKGYSQILWLDSSVYAIKDIQPAFDIIDQKGYLMQEAGHYVGCWCNDYTLGWFGLTRQEANGMSCYGNAGMLGLDFRMTLPNLFFDKWRVSMQAGCFNGSWKDHRHDLTCGSIIANRLKMIYEKGDEILQYGGPECTVLNETIIFKAQGL